MIGVAYAGEAILAQAPLAYSSLIVDEPKPSYEYSTSVQTPTYNNYAHVRSGGNLERRIYNFATPFGTPIATPIVAAAAEPILAEAKIFQPVCVSLFGIFIYFYLVFWIDFFYIENV